MKEMLTVLLSKRSKFRTQQNKLNGIEEIALPASISANDYIVLWTERLNFTLASKRSESRYYNLLDMHRKNCGISAKPATDIFSQSRTCRMNHRLQSLLILSLAVALCTITDKDEMWDLLYSELPSCKTTKFKYFFEFFRDPFISSTSQKPVKNHCPHGPTEFTIIWW